MSLIERTDERLTTRSTWSSGFAAMHDWSFDRAGADEIALSVHGPLDRLSRVVHLDGRDRGAASRLRVRPEGAGAAPQPRCWR
jgi:hypothetical protein